MLRPTDQQAGAVEANLLQCLPVPGQEHERPRAPLPGIVDGFVVGKRRSSALRRGRMLDVFEFDRAPGRVFDRQQRQPVQHARPACRGAVQLVADCVGENEVRVNAATLAHLRVQVVARFVDRQWLEVKVAGQPLRDALHGRRLGDVLDRAVADQDDPQRILLADPDAGQLADRVHRIGVHRVGILDKQQGRLAARGLMLDEHGHHVHQLVQRIEVVLVAVTRQYGLEELRRIDAFAVDDGNRTVSGALPRVFMDQRRFARQRGPLEQPEPRIVLQRLVKKFPGFLLARIAEEDQRSTRGPERLFLQAGGA